MTELEYIRVSHLARVRAMKALLRDLTPGVDDVIGVGAMQAVGEVLSVWDEALMKRIELEPQYETAPDVEAPGG